jgi:rhodanese-related sulfurtransferase
MGKQFRRALLLAAIFALLLPQLLFSNLSLNNCCGRWLGPLYLGLASAASYVDVNVSQAKQMIDSNPNLVILDVRTQEEYDGGHTQNATLIPITELASRIDELNKERETLVYCRSGGRSATASQMLVDDGFSKVYNMLGGITAWRNAGYWIEIVHRGDLIIDGTQTYVVENCTFIQTGNIYVGDDGKLIVRDAELRMNQTYGWQFWFELEDYSTLELKNAVLTSDYVFNFNFLDYSQAILENVSLGKSFFPSFFFMKSFSRVSVYNCVLTASSSRPSQPANIRSCTLRIQRLE